MSTPLDQMIRLGQRADNVILQNIQHQYISRDFTPSLSYHFAAGGKRVRAAMVMLACGATGGSPKNAIAPAAVVEMIHNYSLVMDDIIDHADIRRGKPSVRAVLGDSIALLVAMAYRELLDQLIETCIVKDKIRRVAVRVMTEIIDGERLDLMLEQSGRSDPYLKSHRISHPSFNYYLEMIGKKTASLFRAAAEIGALTARTDSSKVRALELYGWNTGLAFQIMDDILDITGNDTGKEKAKDIIEHKLGNAVVLVGMKFLSRKDRQKLMSILETKKVSRRLAEHARRMIMETPAEETCREIAKSYSAKALLQLENIRESRYKRGLVSLCNSMVNRSF
jgi:geranylgeranyl diphosphate synthase type I